MILLDCLLVTDTAVFTEHPNVSPALACHWATHTPATLILNLHKNTCDNSVLTLPLTAICLARCHLNWSRQLDFIWGIHLRLNPSPPPFSSNSLRCLGVGPRQADLPRDRPDEIASSAGCSGQENRRRMEHRRELHNEQEGLRGERRGRKKL